MMTTDDRAQIAEVLQFWLGEPDDNGLCKSEQAARWWKKDPAFDAEIRAKFGPLHERAVAGELAHWTDELEGLLAVVIIIDQFSRNMFRNDPKTWAHDHLTAELAQQAIERGWDRQLQGHSRVFLYMPLMHSEQLAHQDQCVALFEAMNDELQGEARQRLASNLKYAIAHRDIVARFGRFPHRNAILGRESSEEEREFLTQPGSSF